MQIQIKTWINTKDLGGYSVGVPPLPIPNREVKPDSADGTASSGRVGRRQLKPTPDSLMSPGFFLPRSGKYKPELFIS